MVESYIIGGGAC